MPNITRFIPDVRSFLVAILIGCVGYLALESAMVSLVGVATAKSHTLIGVPGGTIEELRSKVNLFAKYAFTGDMFTIYLFLVAMSALAAAGFLIALFSQFRYAPAIIASALGFVSASKFPTWIALEWDWSSGFQDIVASNQAAIFPNGIGWLELLSPNTGDTTLQALALLLGAAFILAIVDYKRVRVVNSVIAVLAGSSRSASSAR